MQTQSLRTDLQTMLVEVFELGEFDANLTDDVEIVHLGDSLRQLEMLALIERRFGVVLELDDITRFGELVSLVDRKIHD